jgi:hypothetical protein
MKYSILAGVGMGIALGASTGVATESLVVGILIAIGMAMLWTIVFANAQDETNETDRGSLPE